MKQTDTIKARMLSLAREYYQAAFAEDKAFQDGDRIAYAGRVFDSRELCNLIDCSLDFWLTAGRYTEQFERELREFLQASHCSLVNSGSSANLLAFMALTSPKLKERAIRRGDEVITVAAGFPTTISPIIQFGAVPVFVDVTIPQYNVDISRLEDALSHKTKAVMLAHTLGNPFDLRFIRAFCEDHDLWLIEDNCDALGSRYFYQGEWRYTGTVGHMGTSSFYPPHHMTMGEGGAVYTNDSGLNRIINSFRDWGRDCWCNPGADDTCRNRFRQQFGELPFGYDHKYVYSHFGYNLKATDMQAAVGCAQLEKLPSFIKARRENWKALYDGLYDLSHVLILPEEAEGTQASWFGFIMTVREDAPFTRDEITAYLESRNIQTRNLFAGNIIRHPCFDQMREAGTGYRVAGPLTCTDTIMKDSFWIGVYPGMDDRRLDYMITGIKGFVKSK